MKHKEVEEKLNTSFGHLFFFFSKQTKCQKAQVENNNNQRSKARATALGGS
jgi:hypothetical protein